MPNTTGRAIWKGTISFSLVTIPVGLYPVTGDTDKVSFHQYSKAGGRIRMKRVTEEDPGTEVPYADVVKGLELAPGKVITLTKDELDGIAVPSAREIAVEHVVQAADIDPMLLSGTRYYVAPDKAGARAYMLLRDALSESGQAAVVKITLRARESVALLTARDSVLVLELLNWASDIRTPAFPVLEESAVVISQAERDMATQLIGFMAGKFDPAAYTDEYDAALRELVEAKSSGIALPTAPEAPTATSNLTDALAASLAAAARQAA